jgi:phosphate transport system protein
MSKHLRRDLDRLEKRLLMLGARVEETVRKSIEALLERRGDLALAVIGGDPEIDAEEVEIEEECLKILALHQPVAGDLRIVAACLKINSDLERIGDLAVNIAERAASMHRNLPFSVPDGLRPMMECSATMLRESLDAFVQQNVSLARKVMSDDDMVDVANRDNIRAMVEVMKHDSSCVEDAILFLSASKNLERIADHATNIAEDVIYMVGGDIVRHAHSSGPGRRDRRS